jgi:hypothetical protein
MFLRIPLFLLVQHGFLMATGHFFLVPGTGSSVAVEVQSMIKAEYSFVKYPDSVKCRVFCNIDLFNLMMYSLQISPRRSRSGRVLILALSAEFSDSKVNRQYLLGVGTSRE